MDHVISSCIPQMIKKSKGKIVRFVFLLMRYLLWAGADPGVCFGLLTQGCAAKEWLRLAPQDLPPHSEPLVPLGMTLPAFSTHPPIVSRRGAAQALLLISCWVESLSCLYWMWREEGPVVSSATSKRRKLHSSVSKLATSLGFCNRGRILEAFSKGIKPGFISLFLPLLHFFPFFALFSEIHQ